MITSSGSTLPGGFFLGRMAYLTGLGLGLLSNVVGLLRSCVEYQDVLVFHSAGSRGADPNI
ncbi:hypothetical protein NITLEN_10647 [Nitrospira lenta]|uniref:Uncharacterized protein n=1 Tax=Nitrospira lenta TaxID=1436998 RepID=A0A330L1B3_9BACT|nr:hypothetical protein NITLEN_10647 [Nitrospira lenta]